MKRLSLSVMMTNHNHGKFIARAIEAIVSQSRPPDEYILVDDGSTDNSAEIITSYAQRYSYIRFIKNDCNLGVSATAERLLNMATRDYVYAASADDYVLSGFFEKTMGLLHEYPQAGLCCSDPVFLEEDTGTVKVNKLRWSVKPRYFSPDELAQIIRGGYIAGHTSIVKRSSLVELGGFIPELRWHCDWFASHVIAFRYGICYIPEPLATLTVHPDSYSAAGRKNLALQREILNHLLVLLKSPAYRDVLPFFQKGNLMCHFGGGIVRVFFSNPKHWDYQTFKLIKRPLWNEFLNTLSSITPLWAKRIVRFMRGRFTS